MHGKSHVTLRVAKLKVAAFLVHLYIYIVTTVLEGSTGVQKGHRKMGRGSAGLRAHRPMPGGQECSGELTGRWNPRERPGKA
jgi:hypothetical protein